VCAAPVHRLRADRKRAQEICWAGHERVVSMGRDEMVDADPVEAERTEAKSYGRRPLGMRSDWPH
jgi:hypothetical protein